MKEKIKFKHRATDTMEENILSYLKKFENTQGLYIIKAKETDTLKKICKKLDYEYKSPIAYVGKAGLKKSTNLYKRAKQEMGWANFEAATFVRKIGKYLNFDVKDKKNKILQKITKKFILENFDIECIILEKGIDIKISEITKIKELKPCLNDKYNFEEISDNDAKVFIDDVFNEIRKAKSIEEIEKIYFKTSIPEKNMMKDNYYPKINFKISRKDIIELQKNKKISEQYTFTSELASEENNTLIKILYSIIWKNGDLIKVKHIIQGIMHSELVDDENDNDEADEENDNDEKLDSLVFYQFGKYLTKENNEPIIDQHVIRAYKVSICNEEEINESRKISILKGRDHIVLIDQYKNWLNSSEISKELKEVPEYNYYIDKLLFAAGKSIKLKNKK